MRSDVSFDSGGLTLAAHLYTPDGDEAMPDSGARVGPSSGVKETDLRTLCGAPSREGFVTLRAFAPSVSGGERGRAPRAGRRHAPYGAFSRRRSRSDTRHYVCSTGANRCARDLRLGWVRARRGSRRRADQGHRYRRRGRCCPPLPFRRRGRQSGRGAMDRRPSTISQHRRRSVCPPG